MGKIGKGKKESRKQAEKSDSKPESDMPEKDKGLEKAQEEIENRLLRLQADFDNFRKRVARERSDTYTRANEDIMTEMIPVIDHMDMAIRSAEEHDAPPALLDGVRLVADQMKSALSKFGLEKIDATGKEFDPNEHEAISHLPSEEFAENMVMDQTRFGYKLKGRILRAAQVVVSSGQPQQQAEKED